MERERNFEFYKMEMESMEREAKEYWAREKYVRMWKNAKTKFYMLLLLDCHILPRSSLGAEEKNEKDCFSKIEAVAGLQYSGTSCL